MRKLAIFCAAFALAAAGYIWLLSAVTAVLLGGLLLVGCIVLFLLPRKGIKNEKIVKIRKISRIAALGAALGLLWTWSYELVQIQPLRSYVGQRTSLRCTVISEVESTDFGCRVTAELDHGRILLYLNCPPEEISLGDRLQLKAKVTDVSRGTPKEGNLYFQSKDISLMGIQEGSLQIEKTEKLPYSLWPVHTAIRLRQKIREIFPEDAQGFALALLTGDRSELSYGQRNDLSLSGLSHVVAVSGMHLSLLAGIVMFLFRGKRAIAAIISIGVMFFFAAMLGFTPSVNRAVIMNSLLLLAPVLRREDDPLTSLSFALWVNLLFNPWSIANVSLQLSFGSMVGVFYFGPYFQRGFRHFLGEEAAEKERQFFRLRLIQTASTAVATSLGATVATAPFVAYHMGTVCLIAPLSNLLLLWLVSLVFSLCFAASVLGFLYAPLGSVLGWLLAWPIRLIQWAAGLFADVPYGAIYTTSPYVVIWLIFVYILFAAFLLLRRRCRKRQFLACFTVSLLLCLVLSTVQPADFRFTAMDVGQGQCTVYQSHGVTVVVDCGGAWEDDGGEQLARKLLMEGENQVDCLVLTHYDADHSCGVLQLMDRVRVNCLLLPDVDSDSPERQRILQRAAAQGVEVLFVRALTELSFGSAQITLYPPKNDLKNASLGALMSYEEYDILITGDMDAAAERQLLESYSLPDIEVLIAGHHGSRSSTSPELLQATRPETVLICVGENSYGHPAQEVLDRITAIGAEIYRTDLHGQITITR